jgi:hypothetical protein
MSKPLKKLSPNAASLVVDVAAYNGDHELAIASALKNKRPEKAAFAQMLATPQKIPRGEFLTYSIFHMRGSDRQFQSLSSLKRQASLFTAELHAYCDLSKTVKLARSKAAPLNHLRERIGVALGLSIVSRIHGFKLADWRRIPVMGTKHLDFHLAATKRTKIQVETKGSIVPDNVHREKLSNHASNIAAKKAELRARPHKDWHAGIRYGTITAIDSEHNAKVWLLDPEPEETRWKAADQRIFSRLHFLARWMSLVSPGSEISFAMRERVTQMARSQSLSTFSELPLKNSLGVEIRALEHRGNDSVGGFFYGKTRFGKHPIFVRRLVLGNGYSLLFGMHEDLLKIALTQDFRMLTSYATEPSVIHGEWPERFEGAPAPFLYQTSWGTYCQLTFQG